MYRNPNNNTGQQEIDATKSIFKYLILNYYEMLKQCISNYLQANCLYTLYFWLCLHLIFSTNITRTTSIFSFIF